ncbi:hypothetical protein [Hydrogenophaga sp. BPS33]|uniref:hypothetical protein n=1 Tax=Hydrogenophaga sp. BPS33 TaxID=2651974 RepID=UPI00131FD369|nr:hypothetical protein [Hydrogenophaga sp. BPS33]QHE84843.1 hypothetical protein F9K07_08070 [Hydrogenophaga sp. BPS33]
MKPTAEDQLQGTCRILETVVAPCVVDPLARTILDGLVANLRMLTGALPAVPGFLRDDNQATAQLLATLRGSVPGDLAVQVERALSEPEPDAVDPRALDLRNHQLRALLAQAVCSEDLKPEQHSTIVRHMTERASRVPMRYVATAPTPAPIAKKS